MRMTATRRVILALLLLVTATAVPRAASAGGFTISIMGGRRSSSLVNLARPDDPAALFHNPAGLADQKGVHLHFSNAFYLVSTDFRLKALDPTFYPEVNPAGCGTSGQPPCPWPIDAEGYYDRSMEPESTFGTIPYLGVSTDLGFLGKTGESIVAAAALYLPAFYGATLPSEAPSAYHMVDGSFAVGSATFGAGWRISRYISVGASVSYNYMRIALKKRFSIVDALTPAGQDPTGEALLAQRAIGDITIDYVGTDHGIGWGTGVLLSPTDWLAVGLNYIGAVSPRFEGDVSLSSRDTKVMEDAFKLMGYKIPKELEVEMAFPHSLQAGIAIMPTSWLEFGVDLRLWLYQVYERQTVKPIYDPNEPGEEPITEEAMSADKDYGLSYEIAAGALVRPFTSIPKLELMAGFSYDQSPVPDETFGLDNPSLSSLNFAMGARWAITDRWRVTLSYMMYVYLERDIDNSRAVPPANGQGSGMAYLPAFEVEHTF